MNEQVKRYESNNGLMDEEYDGDWITYADYAKLELELKKIAEVLGCSESQDVVFTATTCYEQWWKRIEEVKVLELELRDTRRALLEVCEQTNRRLDFYLEVARAKRERGAEDERA